MRVLLIEDDKLMSRALGLMLDQAGFDHEAVTSGEAGVDMARLYDYDAIILDLSLPDVHGYEVLRQVRTSRVNTPVMILTGDAEIASKVSGFGHGADDYVTKPFSKEELMARLHALVRRSNGHGDSIVTTGPIKLDLASRTVEVNGERVHLTGKEFAILEMLSLRKGMTLTKEMFLNHLYGGRDEPELKIIDVFVCKLRKKLHLAGASPTACIETVWGRGYALRDPEEGAAVAA